MNVLGLIFSILLILSYGFYACWDKEAASTRLRSTYIGHQKVNRTILNRYQSEFYNHSLHGTSTSSREEEEEKDSPSKERSKKPELNRECAKINLWPLIQEGRTNHPLLYELAAKMIRIFYGSFHAEKSWEYHFLDALLASAKQAIQEKTSFALEKLTVNDFERSYYKMLKGTKEWDLASELGYPSLLDYIKAEPSTDKICLFHSHPDLMTVLFNSEVAAKLYQDTRPKKGSPLTKELIEKVCSEMHYFALDPDLFPLLEFGHSNHNEQKKTFIAEDKETNVSLRKNFFLKS